MEDTALVAVGRRHFDPSPTTENPLQPQPRDLDYILAVSDNMLLTAGAIVTITVLASQRPGTDQITA